MPRPVFAVLALIALVPAAAPAQVTTVIVPPPRATPLEAALRDSVVAARKDSTTQATLSDLKAWVDSAATAAGAPTLAAAPGDSGAAAAPLPPAPADSATVADSSASGERSAEGRRASPSRDATRGGTTEFREGAPAPDTASPLPALALLGLGALAGGLLLRRRRTRA